MFLIIYPPVGKQKVGNVEMIDHLSEEVLKQSANDLVKVINMMNCDECYELIRAFGWKEVKTLRESDQGAPND